MDTRPDPAPHPSTETVTVPVIGEHIGIRTGYCGGEPHILGHRIKVRHIAIWHEKEGLSPVEIVATHPTITLAQVHAALAYFYDHQVEIQTAIAAEGRFVEGIKVENGPSLLQEKFKQRNAKDDSVSS